MSKTIEMRDKFNANVERLNEIADICNRENREMTEAEANECRSLKSDNEKLMRSAEVHKMAELVGNKSSFADADALVRENVLSGKQTEFQITRSNDPTGGMSPSGKLNMVADVTGKGLIPVHNQPFTEAIEEGTIYDKLPGLKLESGLAGDYIWPIVAGVSASIVGEGVKLADTELDITKAQARPERMGLAIPVTRETINQTEGVVENIVSRLMPKAVAKLINKIMFSTTKVTGATNLVGPFQPLAASGFRKLGTAPVLADLNDLKWDLLKEGVDGTNICWVMSPANLAIFEVMPKDAGSGVMVAENGKILGIPVFTTTEITDSFIGIGDFSYAPCGFFGNMSMIADPYSRARANSVDFVLNANFAITILQQKAFKLGKLVTK